MRGKGDTASAMGTLNIFLARKFRSIAERAPSMAKRLGGCQNPL